MAKRAEIDLDEEYWSNLGIRLTEREKRRWKTSAVRLGVSLSSWIREALNNHADKTEKRP